MAKKKKKKGNPLLILLFALVLLIAGYFGTVKYIEYSDNKKLQESEAEKEASTPYLNRIEKFVSFSYTNQEDTLGFIFDAENEQWYSQDVEDFPISYTKFTTVVYAFQELTGERKLENITEEELSEYGLDEPAYRVYGEDAEGNGFTMYVGNQNATTGDYYAMLEGDSGTVYTINSNLVTYLNYDLYDLIQMESYPSISEDTLRSLSFDVDGENIVFVERQTETESDTASETETSDETEESQEESDAEEQIQWQLTGEGSADDLVSMVSQISFSSCADYHVTEDNLSQYGFDQPAGVLTVTYMENADADETNTVTLTIGGYDEESDSYYCLMDDSYMVNLVSASSLSAVLAGK